MLKTCKCGNKFTPSNNRQIYCDNACWWKYHGKNHRKELREVLKQQCLCCGKVFETTDSRKKYCSSSCKIQYCNDQRLRPHKGTEGNCEVCGKPYVVSRNPTKRTCSERCARFKCKFDGNRIKALRRDNFTCQKCGKDKKVQLQVHHKDVSGRTENPNHELDNLVTLCTMCHAKVHKIIRDLHANKNLIEIKSPIK